MGFTFTWSNGSRGNRFDNGLDSFEYVNTKTICRSAIYNNTSSKWGSYYSFVVGVSSSQNYTYIDGGSETSQNDLIDDENGHYIKLTGTFTYNSETYILPLLNTFSTKGTFASDDIPVFTNKADFIEYITTPAPVSAITANGGGATHIAKVTGQLKNLSSNLSDILLVSGGGGGGIIVGEDAYTGKDAGGISGSGDNSANQTTGYAFGQGESDEGVSGGGGGLYGGYKGGTS